jgi:putative Mn2+ efflux pump MntP
MLTLIILSCSVAADATAVSIAASVRGITIARGLAMASLFGAAQALMAGIGWVGGALLGDIWSTWDHWVALVLLSAVGLKMIWEAFADGDEAKSATAGIVPLLVLAVATSIDALAVGVSLPTLKVAAALALTMIGVVTFLFSAAGAALGRFLGARFGRAVEVAGGLGLIAIGIRIVVQHLS